MSEPGNENPFSPPNTSSRNGSGWSLADLIKVTISIVLMICLIPLIPFGLLGKGAFLFGTSYGIFNYSTKLKAEKAVRECRNCQRTVGVNTRICPRCEQHIT